MILIRPILAFFTHNHLLSLAETYFTSLLEPFKSAALPCSLEISRYSNLDSLASSSSPAELIEKILTTTTSTLSLYLPEDYSLSIQIQTPFQLSHVYVWVHPFVLRTSSPAQADGEILLDALSDAESPITLLVEESLSCVTQEILGGKWRKVQLREFECKGKRLRVELRGKHNLGKITVLYGDQELDCVERSLRDVLIEISGDV
jgi:hypothetical protein